MRHFKIIISDLHVGADREAEGNALEDFGSDAQFAALVDDLIAESSSTRAAVELIFAGDTFEMLQIPHVDTFEPSAVYAPEFYHSSCESDSMRKVALAIAGHPQIFESLSRFVRAFPPRRTVTFIKGNHDINLHWPGVQDHIRQAIRPLYSSLVAFEERRVSREQLYVEHGNQYGEFLSRVPDMDHPLDPERPGQLKLPPGSWLVMNAFNRVERERYWIDGVKPTTSLIWYALVYDFEFAAWAIAELIRALPGTIGSALDSEEPVASLAAQLEDPAQVQVLSGRYQADPAFRQLFNAEVARVLAPVPAAELDGPRSPASESAVAMGDQARIQVRSALLDAARRIAAEEGAAVVVFGHSHEPLRQEFDGGTYLNSGTWTWSGDFTGAGPETWRELFEHPERFTDDRRLSYVRVDYDGAGRPAGRLLEVPRDALPPAPPRPRSFWSRALALLRDTWRLIFGG